MAFGFDEKWLADRNQALDRAHDNQRAPSRPPAVPPRVNGSPPKRGSKYRNKPVLVDLGPSGEVVGGKLRLVHTFDSQREADYYQDLKVRRAAGEISDLELQKPYALIAHAQAGPDVIIGYYEADFVFFEIRVREPRAYGKVRIVDVKGMKTQVYALKKKIVEACWNITIEEV